MLQILLCRASVFDELIQYHSDGFMANWRVNRAMGLAIVDVAQTALKYVVVNDIYIIGCGIFNHINTLAEIVSKRSRNGRS